MPIARGWIGLTVSADGRRVYASGGTEDRILVYNFAEGALSFAFDIKLKSGTYPAGLTVDKAGDKLFAVGNLDNFFHVVDLKERRVISSIPIGAKPYACAISADERTAYVSHWGGDSVAVIDLATARVVKNIKVQDHPNDLVLTSSGARLFVANGNRNTVSVIDTRKAEVIEQIDVALVPKSPLGSTPNALALSSDEKTLFVANADNNCLAVIDIAQGKGSVPRGFIPTGWYPTAIGVATTGKKLIVANGKGSASRENASLWNEGFDRKNPGYVGNLLEGTLSFIDMPTAKTLALYSQQVHRNSPGGRKKLSSIKAPFLLGTRSPIKHIIYIVKENRTYDQILCDVPEGNGDPTYCLFPEEVTPNHHALARQFVLFDNLYHDAEVSADGHHWTTSAYATDIVEKSWPSAYGGRGGRSSAVLHSDPEVYSSGGFLWDLCARAGISYRSYGEFARIDFGRPRAKTDPPPKVRAAAPGLEGHFHPTYIGADGIAVMSDSERFGLFYKDLQAFEVKGEMPRFQIMSLPGDHTLGTRAGAQTPRAMMAENDLALGRIVEAVSRSRFWRSTAIFVVEDDTQGGPDHVDFHRTVAFIISPYTRRRFVDSTMYSSSSMLRTMELILGLPPLSQFDQAATPMWKSFQTEANLGTYRAMPARILLDEKNATTAYKAERSLELTLDKADTAPDNEFNEILWKAIKGQGAALPPRRVAAFLRYKDQD